MLMQICVPPGIKQPFTGSLPLGAALKDSTPVRGEGYEPTALSVEPRLSRIDDLLRPSQHYRNIVTKEMDRFGGT
ncbi:hypothetical protein B7463_g10987, partial [Scytalidium lignicola]